MAQFLHSILQIAVYNPSLFHNFKVSQGAWNPPLKNYGFIYHTVTFIYLYACARNSYVKPITVVRPLRNDILQNALSLLDVASWTYWPLYIHMD